MPLTIIYKTQVRNIPTHEDEFGTVHLCLACTRQVEAEEFIASIGYAEDEELPVDCCEVCSIPFNLLNE